MRPCVVALVAGVAASLVAGCALIAGTNGYAVDPSLDDGSTGGHDGAPSGDVSAEAGDASVPDGSGDGGDVGVDVAGEARSDAADASETGAVDGSIYTSLTGNGVWWSFDATIATSDAVNGYNGGAFDGKYMYFAPLGGSALRLDTSMPGSFGDVTAWTAQPITAVGMDGGTITPRGFSGAVFDGQYVYFVPYLTGTSTLQSQVVRYDTTAAFGTTSSWEAFDTRAQFGSKAAGFQGGVFDGRYVYFVPNGNGTSGTVVRYDTQGSGFQDPTAWSDADLTTLLSGAPSGFAGGLHLGQYVYLIPTNGNLVARFDTTGTFTSAASWATYDVSQGNTLPYGFVGGAVAGSEIFLAPNFDNLHAKYFGMVYEYGPTAPFGSSTSWPSFDTTTLTGQPQGFFGAAFDGRWVYFAPQLTSVGGPMFSGELARYDTTSTFGSSGSWESFDMHGVNADATGFGGAVFDGTYVYFIPSTSGATFARFLARTAPAAPPFAASFY